MIKMGEPVFKATELMLRDRLRFTKAPLGSNRLRTYEVIALRLGVYAGEPAGETTVQGVGEDEFQYNLTDERLVELGAEIVYGRMGTIS
jgi:hypothetical protein